MAGGFLLLLEFAALSKSFRIHISGAIVTDLASQTNRFRHPPSAPASDCLFWVKELLILDFAARADSSGWGVVADFIADKQNATRRLDQPPLDFDSPTYFVVLGVKTDVLERDLIRMRTVAGLRRTGGQQENCQHEASYAHLVSFLRLVAEAETPAPAAAAG